MITFIGAIIVLIIGYLTYGGFVERVFQIDEERPTPATTMEDGVDFVPMHWSKIFLIQLLNIAGLGPIFGAIAGALWGPVAFLWIVFGTIFAGAVHDYFSGMLSLRHDGTSVAEIVGIYLGPVAKQIMRVFSIILLILVGTVFMTGPANLLASLTPENLNANFWLIIIIIYYFMATFLPVDKVIGKIYPLFGAVLIIMALGISGGLIIGGYDIPNLTIKNLHPTNLSLWPTLFVTIACGAISGFHATQSPMMARCMTNEKYGRRVFYGSMVAEGIIALIWAAAAMTFFGGTEGLQAALADGAQGGVVHTISKALMGPVGGVFAILGVIALPVTSGDTAFRSARLTIADIFNIEQGSLQKRLALTVPIMAIGAALSQINFDIIWRYFAWSNQTLAMIMLWASAAYLVKNNKNHWVCTIPATFMTAVSITYIFQAQEGLNLPTSISYPIGIIGAIAGITWFLYYSSKQGKTAKINA